MLLMFFLACDVKGRENRYHWASRVATALHESPVIHFLVYEGSLLLTAISFHVFVTESGKVSVFDPFEDIIGALLWVGVAALVYNWGVWRFRNRWAQRFTLTRNEALESIVEKSPSPSEGIEKVLHSFVTKRGEDDIEAMISFVEHLSLRQDEVGVAARMKLEAMRRQLPDKSVG